MALTRSRTATHGMLLWTFLLDLLACVARDRARHMRRREFSTFWQAGVETGRSETVIFIVSVSAFVPPALDLAFRRPTEHNHSGAPLVVTFCVNSTCYSLHSPLHPRSALEGIVATLSDLAQVFKLYLNGYAIGSSDVLGKLFYLVKYSHKA